MRYTTLSTIQLFLLAFFMALMAAALVSINMYWMDLNKLPKVYADKSGTCIKVENFENGHAFNCNDVGVVLRRHRNVIQ